MIAGPRKRFGRHLIYAIGIAYNETDIIARTIKHLWWQGIDEILLAVRDAPTAKVARDAGAYVFNDDDEYVQQVTQTNRLAQRAYDAGAEWVLPVDADEFPYPTAGGTIRETLDACTADKLYMRMYQHVGWDHREPDPKPLPKVTCRARDGLRFTNGNHECDTPGGVWGVLDLRELQFRSFEHLQRKCRERVERLDPKLPKTEAAHQRRLYAMSDDELRAEWDLMVARANVFDPVPSSSPSTATPNILPPAS